ncbi:MAG: hypothetical protein J6A59_01765 [Lachnospiraceae bacterium]|nr:hypothetical protein [Lachnospiraceae bacterium]
MEQLSLFDVGLVEKKESKKVSSEKIIRASDMKVLQIKSFVYTLEIWHYEDGHWHTVSSTIALLDNNMVYFKDFFTYPFLYTFKNEQSACKFYYENLEKLREHGDRTIHTELKIHNKLEDMYYCKDNRYSCFEYWNNNFNPKNTWKERYAT